MKIKVLLLGSKEACTQIQLSLRDEEISVVGSVYDENQILDEINRTLPDLILVSDTSSMSLRACHQIYLLRPRSVPVVISDSEDVNDMQRILQTGVHYILPSGLNPINLIIELKGIYSNESNRILAMDNTRTAANKSRVILIFGTKDGIGKTTLAVNLAVKLAREKNKVVLLDYDLQFGDVSSLLGADPKNTILELVQEQSNPNADVIRQFLSFHISGVNFLPAPHSPEYSNSITAAQAERIIAALRVYYDYVIVDAASGFNDISAACIDCASTILFVTEMNIPSLRNAKKGLSVLQALAYSEKIKLVVSKTNDTTVKDISNNDIARVLGIPVWHVIPADDRAVIAAANQGTPLILENSRSKASKMIMKIADAFDGPVEKIKGAKIEESKKTKQERKER